jgi:hypothetical protein
MEWASYYIHKGKATDKCPTVGGSNPVGDATSDTPFVPADFSNPCGYVQRFREEGSRRRFWQRQLA